MVASLPLLFNIRGLYHTHIGNIRSQAPSFFPIFVVLTYLWSHQILVPRIFRSHKYVRPQFCVPHILVPRFLGPTDFRSSNLCSLKICSQEYVVPKIVVGWNLRLKLNLRARYLLIFYLCGILVGNCFLNTNFILFRILVGDDPWTSFLCIF